MESETMVMPYYKVNVLTGTKAAKVIADPAEGAAIIDRAKNPLYIFGPEVIATPVGDKLLIDYALKIAKARDIPICATAHVKKKMLEQGVVPDSTYDIIEIIHFLKDKEWSGVRGKGYHDLVLFTGVRCDLAERGLATLKHFAPHLKTYAICRRSHPNADFALPVIVKEEKWRDYLAGLIGALGAFKS
ncbi:MAG: CO dehydrogenase/acetyl-CoA synthase complex subunit epsilon [Dethiobacter sp.]|jgi:acetyl-CoA decarbonylase/synthase complex subunit epsilon|nr:CO dehydrogenase/acetyl-CoA synthase complex subunit epsilon [Dethiobacter sp.]